MLEGSSKNEEKDVLDKRTGEKLKLLNDIEKLLWEC